MNLTIIERKNNLMDGRMRVNPVIRLKEDVEVCGPYTKFDLIEKGWNPELWGYFLTKDVTLLSENGVQVFKAEEEEVDSFESTSI